MGRPKRAIKEWPISRCDHCGIEFRKRRRNQRFCMIQHGVDWHNAQMMRGKKIVAAMAAAETHGRAGE